MKALLVGLTVLVLLNCSSHSQTTGGEDQQVSDSSKKSETSEAKLTLTGRPRQGFAPFHVSFTARLSGVPDNSKDHYCLREEWDFGDGAVSSQKPNCEPYTESSKVERDFFSEHIFEDPGDYTVRFTLGEEGKKLRSNSIGIVVLEGKPNTGR